MAAAVAERTEAPKTITYCDPWAAGESGPHIRYPDEMGEDGTPRPSQRRLTLRNGNAKVVEGSVEEQVMRRYLERRYGNPDTFKGDTFQGMRCACGFVTKNAEAADAHKARWPDHDMTLVRQ